MNDENLPSYVKLFGEIDFREGDAARSVYSPAAYLTDLLQLIDDEMQLPAATDPARLDQRRPDIIDIPLDSEHTFALLPYLDIVNERRGQVYGLLILILLVVATRRLDPFA